MLSILPSRPGRLVLALVVLTYEKLDQDSDLFLQIVAEHGSSPE